MGRGAGTTQSAKAVSRSKTVITEGDIETFSLGDCHILAHEIHKQTGWPMHAIMDHNGQPQGHVFVLAPTGHAIDVEGVIDMEVEEWTTQHREVSKQDLIDTGWEEEYEGSVERAQEIAPVLVSEAKRSLRLA